MNISCQSIINTERPKQDIQDLKNAGLDRIFFIIYVKFPELCESAKVKKQRKKYSQKTVKERYELVIEECMECGIRTAFLKAPTVPSKSDIHIVLPILENAVTQCLELCKKAECSYLLMELPVQMIGDREEDWQTLHGYLLNTAKKAREYGIMLLLKNQTKEIGGHLVRGFCAEASESMELVDKLNSEVGYEAFGFCVDTGTCNICGNGIQTFINTLGNRIKIVILRENDGYHDVSALPFTGMQSGTDWLSVIRGLRDINFDGELAIDFSSTYASFSPLLRPALYPLARQTMEYFKWQIEIENNLKKYQKFVLFGAGNMCRNYMKCYGEKYPPLFTCDNNPKLWGTTFEGLKVKNPEVLKELPKDCCVVICNIYYREIEVQLRKMGIENIGYFNDEYMPSFYFDRLDNE